LRRFSMLNKIAGSLVTDRLPVLAELLSHNSDYYTAYFIFA
jgi:hypothetical protein